MVKTLLIPEVKPLRKKIVSSLLAVLVTGATGFIGSRLVERLIGRGVQVTSLVRSAGSLPSQVNVVRGDLVYPDFVFPEKEYEIVYHLAAAWPGLKDKKIQRKVNFDGTVNLFERIKDKAKFIVYVSGLGVFDNVREGVITEDTALNPDTDYARTRLDAQKYLEENCEKLGIPLTVTYLGDVYGNGGWFKSMVVDRLRKGSFRIPGSGKYVRSFVHVYDVVSALVSIAEKNQINQSYIVSDSDPVNFSEFVRFICEKMGVKMPGTVPAVLARAILGSDFVSMLTSSIKTSNKKILGVCDFAYPSYRDGIPDVLSEMHSD